MAKGEFTITYYDPFFENLDEMQKCAEYLQKLLNKRGWGIKFNVQYYASDDQNSSPALWQVIETNAGIASDAYMVLKEDAEQLLKDGYAQDLAKVLQDEAPVLYNKYRPLFVNSVAGIPLILRHNPKGGQLALFLQKDIAEELDIPINKMSDVLTLLNNDDRVRISEGFSFSEFIILDAWAGNRDIICFQNTASTRGFMRHSTTRNACLCQWRRFRVSATSSRRALWHMAISEY